MKFEGMKHPPITVGLVRNGQRIERNVQWQQQLNASDCGPCLIANTLQITGHATDTDTVEIRETVNQHRREARNPELPAQGWLNQFDVASYLQKKAGLETDIRISQSRPELSSALLEDIVHELDSGNYEFVFTTHGRHFRGIVKIDGNNFYLLDSFQSTPQQVSRDAVLQLLQQCVRCNNETDASSIGIVRKSEPRAKLFHIEGQTQTTSRKLFEIDRNQDAE